MDSSPVGDPAIAVRTARDGSRAYLIGLPPQALPRVAPGDLAAAWDLARTAALGARDGVACDLRFLGADGATTDLVLADRDARCWAAAVDSVAGMHTRYGLALSLRLLALIDLLRRHRWADDLLVLEAEGATLHARLLDAAANLPLDAAARFDDTAFRARCLPSGPAGEAISGAAP